MRVVVRRACVKDGIEMVSGRLPCRQLDEVAVIDDLGALVLWCFLLELHLATPPHERLEHTIGILPSVGKSKLAGHSSASRPNVGS